MLTVYGIETYTCLMVNLYILCQLQHCLPFKVCTEGCETAEEPCDDEVRTLQVPERSEGKTKEIKQQCLPFTVLKRSRSYDRHTYSHKDVATVPIVYRMRRRVRGSRGAKRR